jgi:hypothetical protein
MWSGILRNVPNAKGSVKHTETAAITKYSTLFDTETSIPANQHDAQIVRLPVELTTNSDGVTGVGTTHDIPLSGCADAGTPLAVGVGRIASAKIGDTVYNIGCIDGDLSISPHFFLDDGTRIITK